MTADPSNLQNSPHRAVAYNDRAFTIHGQPNILLSAAIDHSAVPPELWVDRIAKAKRGGINAIKIDMASDVQAPSPVDWESDREIGAFFDECERQGMYVIVPHSVRVGDEDNSEPIPSTEYALWRQVADGALSIDCGALLSETGRLTDRWRACRRVAMFAQSFKEILLTGKLARDLKSGRGGFRLSETSTRQNGSILWIDNPDANEAITGSVFPYLPEVTLGPRTLFPYVHDAPIGAGVNYLGSYAGLVKSDAYVLAAHILPDPHDGVRVYVYGAPGETREVALWSGNERGHGVDVTFAADAPTVYAAGMSQIVALPESLAGRVWIHPDDENAPVLIGPDDVREHGIEEPVVELLPGRTHTIFALRPDGAITEINVDTPDLPAPPTIGIWESIAEPDCTGVDFDDSAWNEIEDISLDANPLGNESRSFGWYRAQVHLPDGDGGDAQIGFAAGSDRLTLFVNGERIGSTLSEDGDRGRTATFDIRLRDGGNVLCVLANGPRPMCGPVTITPSGGCYLIDVARWRFRAGLYGEQQGWTSGLPTDSASEGPIRWYQSRFALNAPLDTATPLLARLEGMGTGALWLNGRCIGQYIQASGRHRDYYAPEPWMRVGENRLVLVETEGYKPDQVSLVWDDQAAVVTRIAL